MSTLGLFGNDLTALIRNIVKEETHRPVKGLTPGIYANPALTVDASGAIRHIEAGAGGGGGGLTVDGFNAWVENQSIPNATWTNVVIDTSADEWDTGDYTRASDTDRLYLNGQCWLLTFHAYWPVVTGTFGVRNSFDGDVINGDIRSISSVTGISGYVMYSFSLLWNSPGGGSGNAVQVFQNTGASRLLTLNIIGQSLFDAGL